MKKIIIIGSSGFIGKSIKDYIKKKRINISKVFSYSRSEKKNIITIKKLPTANYIVYCINSKKIEESKKYFNHFKQLLVGYSKKTKILFLSSGAVYGKNIKNKKSSENLKININLINKFTGYKKNYAKEKIFLEKKFIELSKNGYKVSIARCFTFVGANIPRNSHFLIGNLINNILTKKELFAKSKFKVIRSFMHTDDLSKCLFMIMNRTKNNCDIYNVGSDDQIDIKLLLKKLSKKYKLKAKILKKFSEKKIDYYVPNIDKIKKELRWKSKFNSFEAIVNTIKEINSIK